MTDELGAEHWDLSSAKDAIDATDDGMKRLEIARFALYYQDSYSLEQRAGAPRETQSLTLTEQTLVEKMRLRGKGTERGSIKFIAEELRERGNSKTLPALIQDIKRYLRGEGLIRRK